MTVWHAVENNLIIKWCHGQCKCFRPWDAFGGHKTSATCVECLEKSISEGPKKVGSDRTERPKKKIGGPRKVPLQSDGAEAKSQRPKKPIATEDKPTGVLSASTTGEPKGAAEELETSEIKAAAQLQSDDADAQVHGDDKMASDVAAKLLPSLNRCLPLGMPIPSRCVLFHVYLLGLVVFSTHCCCCCCCAISVL
jgi:hypothetical protein